MKKHLLIAGAAIALALPLSPTIALAQGAEHAGHREFSSEDISAFTDAKIAGLKAGLKLTSAQEKNWPALETALRDAAKARAARAAESHEKFKEHHEKHNLIEGLHLRAKTLTARAGELDKIADAAKPLFDSLDDAQKRRFHVLLHVILRGGHHGHHGHHGGPGEGGAGHKGH
jgi:hypothetical protein